MLVNNMYDTSTRYYRDIEPSVQQQGDPMLATGSLPSSHASRLTPTRTFLIAAEPRYQGGHLRRPGERDCCSWGPRSGPGSSIGTDGGCQLLRARSS